MLCALCVCDHRHTTYCTSNHDSNGDVVRCTNWLSMIDDLKLRAPFIVAACAQYGTFGIWALPRPHTHAHGILFGACVRILVERLCTHSTIWLRIITEQEQKKTEHERKEPTIKCVCVASRSLLFSFYLSISGVFYILSSSYCTSRPKTGSKQNAVHMNINMVLHVQATEPFDFVFMPSPRPIIKRHKKKLNKRISKQEIPVPATEQQQWQPKICVNALGNRFSSYGFVCCSPANLL